MMSTNPPLATSLVTSHQTRHSQESAHTITFTRRLSAEGYDQLDTVGAVSDRFEAEARKAKQDLAKLKGFMCDLMSEVDAEHAAKIAAMLETLDNS
jgi:hypothetical protein